MTLDSAAELLRHTLVLALFIAAPVLLIGLIVSFVVSLLQAVTQVQEQTLTFIPKIVAMAVCAILLLPWMGRHLVEFARVAFGEGLLK
jgi:flagellar biosynthetic protein FliQ